METTSAHDLILSIKKAIETQGLSFQDVKNLLAAEDVFPADTTLRRLLKPGSEENDSFNFESTLRPIARVLVGNIPAKDDATQAQLDLYREVCLYKHEKIDELQDQLAKQKEDYEKKIAFLKAQMAIKDQQLDKLIDKLLDKL